MSLKEYHEKRNFDKTKEPKGGKPAESGFAYLIQKHDASRLHYDFRLELDGVLKSWAVPKGPSLDPSVKSLAVHVEDHPLEYGSFEGIIPQHEYGGGTVMLWDRGTWEPEGDPRLGYAKGKLVFQLHGERLKGGWALVRMQGKAGEDGKNWLLKKIEDDEALDGSSRALLSEETTSIVSGRTMDEIAAASPKRAKAATRKADPGSASKAGSIAARDAKTKTLVKKTSRATPATALLSSQKKAMPLDLDPGSLAKAFESPMPTQIVPQLASLVQEAPEGSEWIHELKLDGYRLFCFIRNGKVVLKTRAGNDWTHRFPTIAAAAAGLGIDQIILDGEVVALSPDGTTDFQGLQNQLKQRDDQTLVYYTFDLCYAQGFDLRKASLLERKALLAQIVARGGKSSVIRYNDHIIGQGSAVLSNGCRHALEGIVSKRVDGPYVGGRSTYWLKVKCLKRQEFVVGGWTEPGGARSGLGALLLGYYESGSRFVYCGRVGTGFTIQSLQDLHGRLQKLSAKESPFGSIPSGVSTRGVHWVTPVLVAEVAFANWTDDGMLRHASFQGLREDKTPSEIVREEPIDANRVGAARNGTDKKARRSRSPSAPLTTDDPDTQRKEDQVNHAKPPQRLAVKPLSVRLTHPDRVLFPADQVTKGELAAYYESVAPWILPHLIGRPLSLVRCPEGVGKPCFFQKHLTDTMPEFLRGIQVDEKDAQVQYITIDDVKGLISLVQMSVLEIHPWACREDRLDLPDRLIIDLDPAPEVGWNDVIRAAGDVKERLDDLGIESFVRTTGGKGLHIVAPLDRRATWDQLKAFAKAFADALVRHDRARYIAQASKAARSRKIYVDYLRNERGSTAIGSYSSRARDGATVATPITWPELTTKLSPAKFTIKTVPGRLDSIAQDPWLGFFELRQALVSSMTERVERW